MKKGLMWVSLPIHAYMILKWTKYPPRCIRASGYSCLLAETRRFGKTGLPSLHNMPQCTIKIKNYTPEELFHSFKGIRYTYPRAQVVEPGFSASDDRVWPCGLDPLLDFPLNISFCDTEETLLHDGPPILGHCWWGLSLPKTRDLVFLAANVCLPLLHRRWMCVRMVFEISPYILVRVSSPGELPSIFSRQCNPFCMQSKLKYLRLLHGYMLLTPTVVVEKSRFSRFHVRIRRGCFEISREVQRPLNIYLSLTDIADGSDDSLKQMWLQSAFKGNRFVCSRGILVRIEKLAWNISVTGAYGFVGCRSLGYIF